MEIERMVIRVENLFIESSSLEPTLLERIRDSLGKISEMEGQEREKIYVWWNDLNNDFIRLNQNYQDYMRELNSVKAEELMKTREFLVFKDRLIEYLRSFVRSLQTNVNVIEERLKSTERKTIERILGEVTEYEISIPRIDVEVDREQVLQGTEGVCDRYIFTDARRVKENLMELLDIENGENDILLYQNVSGVLSAIGWRGRDKEGEGDLPGSREGSWIDERGIYGMGVLEGTITGAYIPRYIGASSREEYRRKKICELEEQQKELAEEIGKLARELEALEKREEKLEEEWSGFPKEQDLKIAAREYERREERLKDLTEKIQSQREHTEEERKVLEEIRSRAREICQKCYLAARLELFQEEYLEDIDQDLDDIRYELGGIQRNRKALTASLTSVLEQLKLTDYEKIQARLNYCLERLSSLPGEKEESVREKSRLDAEDENLSRLIQENLMEKGKKARKKERLSLAFEKEYRLGYVERGFPVNEDMEDQARKAAGDSGNLQSFHAIMREVLDYRQWFEFQLECQKTGEKRRELTDRVFFTFSGGEKAMAMYVPLFSAVVAKYAGARQDAPRLISLDEAFAGVDEMNIRDMFRLMVEFDFNFMINSQILWGDYDTVPALAIYQLVRPENAKYVTVIPYIWNGKVKSMVNTVR